MIDYHSNKINVLQFIKSIQILIANFHHKKNKKQNPNINFMRYNIKSDLILHH